MQLESSCTVDLKSRSAYGILTQTGTEGGIAMTEYGTLLRRLVDFTGSKLYAVADEVGYDVS